MNLAFSSISCLQTCAFEFSSRMVSKRAPGSGALLKNLKEKSIRQILKNVLFSGLDQSISTLKFSSCI